MNKFIELGLSALLAKKGPHTRLARADDDSAESPADHTSRPRSFGHSPNRKRKDRGFFIAYFG